MKSYISIFLVLFILLGCSNESDTFKLTGEINGLRKGALFLQKIVDTSYVTIDSIRVLGDSEFEFKADLEEPEVLFLAMQFDDSVGTTKRISFFAEPKPMQLHSTLKNYELDIAVKGSVNQEKWEDYQKLMARYNDKYLTLVQEQFDAMKSGSDSLIKNAELKQQRLVASRYLATVNYAKNNNDYEIAPYLMLAEIYDANIKYHDTIYKLLPQKIKDSKYGKALESYIEGRKKDSL